MAPNVFHVGVKEHVSITLFDAGNPVNVQLYLQDYPHRRKTFSPIQRRVAQGKKNQITPQIIYQDLKLKGKY